MWVQFLASLSELRIWHCCELQCRWQTQLRAQVAVAVWRRLTAAAPIWPLAGKLPWGCSPKKTKKKKKQEPKNPGGLGPLGLSSAFNFRANSLFWNIIFAPQLWFWSLVKGLRCVPNPLLWQDSNDKLCVLCDQQLKPLLCSLFFVFLASTCKYRQLKLHWLKPIGIYFS